MFKTKVMKSMKVGIAALAGVAVLSTSVLVNAVTKRTPNLTGKANITSTTYGQTGAFQFIGDTERWISIKVSGTKKTSQLTDSDGNKRVYEAGQLGHANDATYYNKELLVATAGDKFQYGHTDAGDYPIIRLNADDTSDKSKLYKVIGGYSFNSELKSHIKSITGNSESGVGGITYIPNRKYNGYPVFVLKCKHQLLKVYLNGDKFGFISAFEMEYPKPVEKKDNQAYSLVGQGVTYDKKSEKLYMAFGVRKNKKKCDNRMLIGCISFNELKKGSKEKDGAKRKLTTYINDYKNGYSTFEIECISFDKDGKMYFDVNGKQNGEQLDKVVKVDSVN